MLLAVQENGSDGHVSVTGADYANKPIRGLVSLRFKVRTWFRRAESSGKANHPRGPALDLAMLSVPESSSSVRSAIPGLGSLHYA
jgi:hypothetical protein